MACTQIPEPASTSPATSDWQKELAKVAYIGGEARKFRLTNWETSAEPQVEIGSRFEVNGAYYVCSANESITGWSGISDASFCFVYATASAGTVTFSYSATVPTFSSALGGYYNGTTRALFRIYRTDVTHWDLKIYVDDENWDKDAITVNGISFAEGNAGTFNSSVDLVANETWLIPAGTYIIVSTLPGSDAGAGVFLQIKGTSTTWYPTTMNVVFSGMIVSDGINYRLKNNYTGLRTIYYRKIA